MVARALAGQFAIVRLNESGELIPMTFADNSAADGTITLIFQEVGKSIIQIGLLEVGDSSEILVGPLGRPTQVKNYGKVVLIGARTKTLLFWRTYAILLGSLDCPQCRQHLWPATTS